MVGKSKQKSLYFLIPFNFFSHIIDNNACCLNKYVLVCGSKSFKFPGPVCIQSSSLYCDHPPPLQPHLNYGENLNMIANKP